MSNGRFWVYRRLGSWDLAMPGAPQATAGSDPDFDP